MFRIIRSIRTISIINLCVILVFVMAQKKEKAGKKTIVRRSKSGLGLFAGEDIKKKEFIIEYVGEVLTCKEADIRGGKYLFETSKNRFIDGSTRKNTARYINHSCAPNC